MKDKLIQAVINNKDRLLYINLDENNCYQGWVSNFNIQINNGKNMHLDLTQEKDLFLLFVLASAWSKTDPWENAAFFIIHLKINNKDDVNLWLNKEFVDNEMKNNKQNTLEIVKVCKGIEPRKKVSFRKDYYSSIRVIAQNWNVIKLKLAESNVKNDYSIFIDFISNIKGLGAGENRMKIKIPLILRELRCQNIYDNIPGELCCVPDERVKESAKELGIILPHISTIGSIFKASKIIYDNFGDLYDIPLFAYEDLKKDVNNRPVNVTPVKITKREVSRTSGTTNYDRVIEKIKRKLIENNGKSQIPLLKENQYFNATLVEKGIMVDNLGVEPFLPWEVFTKTMELLESNNSCVYKGNAMYKLGDEKLPIQSVEGYIAEQVYGRQIGQSVFRRISPVVNILIWAEVCENGRGVLKLKSNWRE